MRIALIYNAEAGERLYAAGDLARLFVDAGHDVDAYGSAGREIARAIASKADVLAIAGGDGTVAKTAIAVHERGSALPLFILPIGTSNNVARSLNIEATVPVLVKSLASARSVSLDIGRVSASWMENAAFVEATGLGFIGTMLRRRRTLPARIERFVRNLRPTSDMAAQGVARLIRRQCAQHYEVLADGENLSGDYVAIEAMNITSIGPRTTLAPHANPSDGMLELLLVPSDGREVLANHVTSRDAEHTLPSTWYRRVRRVEISWAPKLGHVDDEPWPSTDGVLARGDRRVVVETQGSVQVLVS